MEANTAMAVAPNTFENKGLLIGLQSVAGTASETKTISNEKKHTYILSSMADTNLLQFCKNNR